MIKVEVVELDGQFRLEFNSNKGREEIDILDQIGTILMSDQPRRGSYRGDTMIIDVRKEPADGEV